MELGDILHGGHMKVGGLLKRMTFFGGGSLDILEDDIEPYIAWEHLVGGMEACSLQCWLGLGSGHVGGVELEEHVEICRLTEDEIRHI